MDLTRVYFCHIFLIYAYCILTIASIYFITTTLRTKIESLKHEKRIKSEHKFERLGDIIAVVENVKDLKADNENQIFFVESTYNVTHELSAMQACNIESAAVNFPELTIFVVFVTPASYARVKVTRSLEALLQYENVKFKFVDVRKIATDTPLSEFILSEKMRKSRKILKKISELLSFILLHKFGGIHLSIAVTTVATEDVENLENFACADAGDAVLKLTGDEGKALSENTLEIAAARLRSGTFKSNDSRFFTEVIRDFYNIPSFERQDNRVDLNHGKFSILPPKFYQRLDLSEKFIAEKSSEAYESFVETLRFVRAIDGDTRANERFMWRVCPKTHEMLKV